MTLYTKENEDENLIAYQQLMNEIKNLSFLHKLTIIESCNSSKLIEKKSIKFQINEEKILDKCHYIITAKNEISTKGDLIKRFMEINGNIKSKNNPLHYVFSEIYKHSKKIENDGGVDNVKPVMRKEGDGNFYFNNSGK